MADSDGHSTGASGAGSSGAGPGSSGAGSNSYSSWYQSSTVLPSASGSRAAASGSGPRAELAKQIARRPRVSWWAGLLMALGFALVVTPAITAERWLSARAPVTAGQAAKLTVRVPPFAGVQAPGGPAVRGGGVIVARGEVATPEQAAAARLVEAARPKGAVPYAAIFALTFVFAALFTHHMRRSTRGRLLRVQLVSLVTIAVLAIAVAAAMLLTPVSILVVPVALLALVPTLVLDRVVGLGTGILAALITSLLVPFDVTVAILLLVQAAAAGLLVAEVPKRRWRTAVIAGLVTTLLTAATLILISYLTRNALPSVRDPLSQPWIAAAIGPAIAMVLVVPLVPLYQLLVGEITQGKLIELEDLSHPLLRQIAERSPGTWQHSLMMANMAEIAANAIGASGRLVRVGAYYHDLGKSLQPKYFIENLQPGETSPHDQLLPEASCEAIFAHVTEGIVVARRAGLHERIVDFMHMHHGNGVLEYFWSKTQEQGNPRGLAIEQFRYPGHPPQSRETAILAICDAVEAASRTLKKPDPASIDALVQRIVYGKLHLGQLDESGLSMADLRRVSESLKDTIRHANHGRIEYPWQKAQQDASASASASAAVEATGPRLDSLDRRPRRDSVRPKPLPPAEIVDDAGASGAVEAQAETLPGSSGSGAGRPMRREDIGIIETEPLAQPVKQATMPAMAPPPAPRSTPPAAKQTQSGPLPAAKQTPPGAMAAAKQAQAPAPAPAYSDELDTPVVPAMLGTVPQTLPGHRPPAPVGQPRAEEWGPGAASSEPRRDEPAPPRPARREEPPAAKRPASKPPAATPRRSAPPPDLAAAIDDARITGERPAVSGLADPRRGALGPDATSTEPSLPRFEQPMPPGASPFDPDPPGGRPAPKWAGGLAARVDAALQDEWANETPIVPPTRAELRALLGSPDPTRQQSIAELEALHRATEDLPSDELFVAPRRPHPTSEVDPDQIEAAIEVAPPARRPNPAVIIKPKKPK